MIHSIIFGGTKGLGRVVARQFLNRGDLVSIVGRTEPPLQDFINNNIKYYQCDITNVDCLKEMIEEIVISRGNINYAVFLQRYRGKEDDWNGEYQTTLSATKNAVDFMTSWFSKNEKDDKAILMVSSVFSQRIGEGQLASYHVAKAGLDQLMKYYAVNLGSKGIRSNGVTPFTFLKEESQSFYLNNTPLMDLYKKIVPLKRMATTDDLANMISFLCSRQAAFITGQNISIDGGLSLIWPETLARQLMNL